MAIGSNFAKPAKAKIPPDIGEAARPKQEAISSGKASEIGLIPSFWAISGASLPKALKAAIPLPIITLAKYTIKLKTIIVSNTAEAPPP